MILVEIIKRDASLFSIHLTKSFNFFQYNWESTFSGKTSDTQSELHVPFQSMRRTAGSPLSQPGLPHWCLFHEVAGGCVLFITISPVPAHNRRAVNIYWMRKKGLSYNCYFNTYAVKNFHLCRRLSRVGKKKCNVNVIIQIFLSWNISIQGVPGIFAIFIGRRGQCREIFKSPPRSGGVQTAQPLLMAEFLMKSEPQGSDLMSHKISDAETRELWRRGGIFLRAISGKHVCLWLIPLPRTVGIISEDFQDKES